MKAGLVIAAVFALAASTALAQTSGAHTPSMTPEQAITAAAANPERGVEGTFEFVVQSVGETKAAQGTIIYLNSEADYRSPDNISAMIMPLTARSMSQALGGPVREAVVGKRVAVAGTAKQTRIDVLDDNRRPIGQYYFQTRISVKGP